VTPTGSDGRSSDGGSAMNQVVVIQWNRKSGSGRGRGELIVLSRRLRKFGFIVRMFSNRSKLDRYVRERFDGEVSDGRSKRTLKCLVAAGGDGTVADVANRHPGIPIAVLPLGTENLLAKFLGMARSGSQVADTICHGGTQWLDTAKANSQRFLLMFSSGLDAEVVDAIHSARTGTIRRISYVIPVLKAFYRSRPRTYRAVSADGSLSVSGSHLIVTNIPRYGFGLPFAPDARGDDGLLDVRAFSGATRWSIFWHAVKLKFGLPVSQNLVHRFTATEITLSCDDGPGLSQFDGDPGPRLPAVIRIEPRSLCVIVPAH
jgi:diacylglycerol kinase (ATP)